MSFFSSTVGVVRSLPVGGLPRVAWMHIPRVIPASPVVNLNLKLADKPTAIPPPMAQASSSRLVPVVAQTPAPPLMSRGFATLVAQPQTRPTRPPLRRASPSQTIQRRAPQPPAVAEPKYALPPAMARGVVGQPQFMPTRPPLRRASPYQTTQ
ncbi:hypothetical protein MIND_00027100 [Mycena indigotica]|uniref:Uncharacterized protein n=1 Tax=Mycena indigotica TaxID=2126181 RepID=A0A8H6TCE7_9AGAR|nr:uncharacterized protein MIND_00027100 [Mycena indigotica]KAF7315128.1 hypothetical protein MIND_00027100 [Mycena indigotica]